MLSLSSGALGVFPALKRILAEAPLLCTAEECVSYSDPSGDPRLRAAIARTILLPKTADDDDDEAISVMVTAGGQNAVSLVLRALIPTASAVLVQQPCFFGALRVVSASSSAVFGWSSATDDLPRLCAAHPGSVVYLTSSHRGGLSACESLAASEKAAVADAARKHGCVVVEDNQTSLARFDASRIGDDAATVFACWPQGVVLLGGFSKVVGAGLRVGFVAHCRGAGFDRTLRSACITDTLFTAVHGQKAVLAALSDAAFLPALHGFLRSRRAAFLACLQSTFRPCGLLDDGRVSWNVPRAGVYLHFAWKEVANAPSLVELCRKHLVAVDSSKFSFLDRIERPMASLNFARLEQSDMEEAVRRLCAACCEYFGLPFVVQEEEKKKAPPPQTPKPLRVLVTSGGTSVMLDGVRVLSNLSQGTTGAMIAEELLRAGHHVTVLYARGSKRPFLRSLELRLSEPVDSELARLRALRIEFEQLRPNLRMVEYFTFEEYMESCQRLLTEEPRIDVGIFAAAVSDFGPKSPTDEKKKMSSDAEPVIQLGLLPKVITKVKQWSPRLFLVTFKLLVGVPVEDLIDVAHKSGVGAHSDLVVANTIVPGSHLSKRQTVIVTPEKGVTPTTVAQLGRDLRLMVERRISTRHWATIPAPIGDTFEQLQGHVRKLQDVALRCAKLGLWIPYSEAAKNGPDFGFAAIRVPSATAGNAQFLITGRGSCKSAPTGLALSDIVFVEHADFEQRKLHVRGMDGRRASLNANVAAGIFRSRPEVDVIVHAHVFPDAPVSTQEDFAPGTQEDFDECLRAISSGQSLVHLINHGILAFGKSLDEILQQIGESHTYRLHPGDYDVIYNRFQSSIGEFVQLVSSCNQDRSAEVLDIAAGSGSVSKALGDLGYRNITLCDTSGAMLGVAVKKLEPVLLRTPRTIVCPMQRISEPPGSFDVAMCRQAINYAESIDALVETFKRIHSCLRQHGKLVFNAPNFSEERRGDYTSSATFDYTLPDGRAVHLRESNSLLDPDSRLLHHVQHCIVTKTEGEAVSRQVLFDHNAFTLYTAPEFEGALRRAGFASVELFGKHMAPCTPESRSLYVVASK